MSSSSYSEQRSSPSQLALDIHPYTTSIDKISSDHGLTHDSGVSFGMSSRKRNALQQQRRAMSESSSSSSLKKVQAITDEARNENRVIESPTATSAFDASEDVWRDVARRLKPFGDTLRHERLRTPLGETDLADNCLDILQYSCRLPSDSTALREAQIEVLRTLANLCIDHDENRSLLLEKQGPQTIISLLQSIISSKEVEFSMTVVTLLRIAMGALLNMQLDHPDTRIALRQDEVAMETLLQVATDERVYILGEWYSKVGSSKQEAKARISTGASISAWSWRVVQDVCANDTKDQGSFADTSKKVDEDGEKAIEGIVAIGPYKAAQYMVKPLRSFTSIHNTVTAAGPWNADDVCDLMESDMDVIQITTELLEACSLDSKAFRLSSLQETLELLMQYLDRAEIPQAWSLDRDKGNDNLPPKPSDAESTKEVHRNFSRAKAAVAKAIVCIAGEDENMSLLFQAKGNWFMDTLKNWMSRDAKKRDDLVSTAMLAMGNLARKDSHCLALVHEHGLVPILSALLTPNADIKVAHGVVCLLKNLSIPPANKQIIGNNHKNMPLLSHYLIAEMDKVQPLQFATVGLLKHLCAGCAENAMDMVNKGDTLEVLLQLLQRTEDVPTRMEGTRVLVNVTKTLWTSGQDASRLQARQKLVTSPVAIALAEMVRSSPKYPVLVNEGILAMTLIASEGERQGARLVASALLSDPTLEELNALSQSSITEGETLAAAATTNATPVKGETALKKPSPAKDRAPSRKATMDSLASQSSQPLPPPRTSADMIANVLARRDARMPPQFASNACILVQTLVDGSQSTKKNLLATLSSSEYNDESVRRVLQSWTKALVQLSEVGPQETIALAKQSLKSTTDFLAS